MRKLSIILTAVLFLLGLEACRKDPKSVEPTSLTINPTAVTLKVGETKQLTATVEPKAQSYTVTFASDNDKVATVDTKGLVKAVAEGTANVTAKVGKLTAKCVVTVTTTAAEVKLEVNTPTLSIEKGKTAQIDYTVTPADTPVAFTSDKKDIATVDDKGLVTGIAAGSATITLAAAGEQATVAVTVTDNGSQTVTNELPLLKFNPSYDLDTEKVNDPEVLAHERKVGRRPARFKIGIQGPFDGFANTNLTITGVLYGMFDANTKENVIPAFSKESLANCPKTTAMLAEYGFTRLEDKETVDGDPYKVATKDDDPTITLEMRDAPHYDLKSTLQIDFIQKQNFKIAHPILADAKDFPSYEVFDKGDVAKIKEFETNLGFRKYNAKYSKEDKKNLVFDTSEDKIQKTNIEWVQYISTPSTGPKFINCKLNCFKNKNDFIDPKLKEWFKANGFAKDFKADAEHGYALGYDAAGRIKAELKMYNSGAYLHIFDSTSKLTVQMQRLFIHKL